MAREYNLVIAHYQSQVISGAENAIADLVDQIDPRFQITMLVPARGNLARFYQKRGFSVWIRPIETPRRLFPGLHQLQSWSLARDLRDRAVDAVLCNTFPAASRVATACRMANLPHAIYMRDYIPGLPLHRQILNRADLLFAISKDVIHQHAGMVDPLRFCLAYDYINPDPILNRYDAHTASAQRILPFEGQPVVGLIGRITPYKQPDLFIRAIPFVLREIPEARFVIVGSAQPRERHYEEKVIQLAAELGIDGQVAFLGQRQDVVELTSELSVSCLVSGREPLGRVILEAQLLGVPVIAPDTGGPAEIVENEVTGLHFPSQSADAEIQLSRQIIRLLKDTDLRDCLAHKARESVFTSFASHKHVRIQEEFIEQLCAIHYAN